MIFIFYYIYNNLNMPHIIVSHHEAERAIVVRTPRYVVVVIVEVEHTGIITRISGIVTAALD